MSERRKGKWRMFPTAEEVIRELSDKLRDPELPDEERERINKEIDHIVETIPL